MQQPSKEKKPVYEFSWEDEFSDTEQMIQWRDSAFQVALKKFRDSHGNAETVMRTGEAFGRGLFSQKFHEKTPGWTIGEWLEKTEEDVFKPLGTEFTFTKISQDTATIFMNRDPLSHASQESTVASLFRYGVMRGLFQSAFPKGELLFNEVHDDDSSEFILKAHASLKDQDERERVKRIFSVLKKKYGP